jgi:hypothetical protein
LEEKIIKQLLLSTMIKAKDMLDEQGLEMVSNLAA